MNTEKNFPLTTNIDLHIKDISFTVWVKQPTVDTLQKKYRLNIPQATLYLQKTINSTNWSNMDELTRRSMSYPISPYNYYDIKKLFKDVKEWFEPDILKELYGTNDNGLLIFNSDYKNLNVIHIDEYSSVKTALKIVPTVVQVGQDVYKPGVVMYINKIANAVLLRDYEILRICNFIIDFNFNWWVNFSLDVFKYCEETNRILSYKEVQQSYLNDNYYY